MRAALKCLLYQMNPNTLLRIGDDLRKGGYLAGMGIVGIVMFSDDISFNEGIILFILGFVVWIIGQYISNLSEQVKTHQQKNRRKK